MEILEPIYVILDDLQVVKYRFISKAERDLEAYDKDIFLAYDSSYRKLELFQLNEKNNMGFRLTNDLKSYKTELEKYVREDFERKAKSNIVGNLEHLLTFIDDEY